MKRPDEFLSRTEKAWDWIEEHSWLVIGVIAGVIVLFLLFQVSVHWFQTREDLPRIELSSALSTQLEPVISETDDYVPGLSRGFRSEQEKYQVAADMFDSIISNHPGTTEAQLARYHAAINYEKLEQYDKAIDYYNKFMDSKVSKIMPVLTESSLFGLARCYYGQDQYQKSIEYLNQVIENNSTFKPDAMILKTRCYFGLGQKEKAEEVLEALKSDHPESWLSQPAHFISTYWRQRDEIINKDSNVTEESLEGQKQ